MKKNFALIFSCCTFIVSFLSFWYSDVLFNRFFIFGIIPLIISVLFLLASLIVSIVYIVRNPSAMKYYFSLLISLISIFLLFTFPFRMAKVDLELQLYDKERSHIIEMV